MTSFTCIYIISDVWIHYKGLYYNGSLYLEWWLIRKWKGGSLWPDWWLKMGKITHSALVMKNNPPLYGF